MQVSNNDDGSSSPYSDSESDCSDVLEPMHTTVRHKADSGDMKKLEKQMAAMSCHSIVSDLVDLEHRLADMRLQALHDRDVLCKPVDYFLQPRWKRQTFSGDQMLDSLETCLAQFDTTEFRRSPEQKEMHLMWTQASIAQIYAAEYASKLPELLRRYKVPIFWPFVAIFATRRFGKTFAMAMFVAAFLWTQQRSVISVFSISQRTSKAMMDKILMMLQKLVPKDKELQVVTKNQENLSIINSIGVTSTVYSYPCSEIRASSLSLSLSLKLVVVVTVTTRYVVHRRKKVKQKGWVFIHVLGVGLAATCHRYWIALAGFGNIHAAVAAAAVADGVGFQRNATGVPTHCVATP